MNLYRSNAYGAKCPACGASSSHAFRILCAGIIMNLKRLSVLLCLSLALPGPLLALDAVEIKAKLLSLGLDVPLEDVVPSEDVSGYFEVRFLDDRVIYMNDTGEYFFAGGLYLLGPGGIMTGTEARQARQGRALLNRLDEAEMIVFSPAPEEIKARVTIFTDIDCAYCRKLHREIQEYNHLGIAVRYLAYPRAGKGSVAWDKAISVWCAADRQAALSTAKAGKQIAPVHCANHPVATHYVLGQALGVTGTPAIVYEDGRLEPGYVTAQEMARRLGIQLADELSDTGSD